MNKTLQDYGTTNPVIVCRMICAHRNHIRALSQDWKKIQARAKKYAAIMQAAITDSPEALALSTRTDHLCKLFRSGQARGWKDSSPTQSQLLLDIETGRQEWMQKFGRYYKILDALTVQYVAQAYLRRHRHDFSH